MNRRVYAGLMSAAVLTGLFGVSSESFAQKMAAKPGAMVKLPSAEKILDDASAAMGSKAAFNRIKTMTMRGKISIPAQNINGKVETVMQFPNKIYVLQEIGGFGKAEQGFDGKEGWSRDPINGLRTLAGGELAQMRSQVDEARSSDWRQLYQKPTMLGIRKVGTANAYALKMVTKGTGKSVTIFYDTKTKLPIRTDIVAETAQGSIPTQSFSSDFRTVNGIKVPFKLRQVVSGVTEINLAFDTVQINTPVERKLFVKPKGPAPKAVTPTKPQ